MCEKEKDCKCECGKCCCKIYRDNADNLDALRYGLEFANKQKEESTSKPSVYFDPNNW